MVNASDCGSEDRGFESHHSPHTKAAFPGATGRGRRNNNWTGFHLPAGTILGCRQVVRHQTLTLAFVGSNPAIPATSEEGSSVSFPRFSKEPRKLHVRSLLPPSPHRSSLRWGPRETALRTARKCRKPPASAVSSIVLRGFSSSPRDPLGWLARGPRGNEVNTIR